MEPSLIIALVLAFGVRLDAEGEWMSRAEALSHVRDAAVLMALLAVVVLGLGQVLARRAGRPQTSSRSLRRSLVRATRAADLLTLGAFAYILFELQWPRVVEQGLGLRGAILADELAILAPYLVGRLVCWWGLYPAERSLRAGYHVRVQVGELLRHLRTRARQSLGLILPAVLLYVLGNDLVARWWPGVLEGAYAPLVGMSLMGVLVLVGAPGLVRLAWPTRPLPPGPLRDRLERLAGRLDFRYSDILIWETNGAFVNAGVTGALPWFRYVLLTDTLVAGLDERELEAVFGHEVGHVAHRHLSYFGFFFLGSLGVLALLDRGITWLTGLGMLGSIGTGTGGESLALVVEAATVLCVLGLYMLLVFGFLSRRFERQADLYGCRAVSCGRPGCPPHLDVNALEPSRPMAMPEVCPMGIRIFASALANVARLNGMEPRARSWRHGSIARRIAFLETLEGRPDRERRFQLSVRRLRLGLGLGLLGALVLAWRIGALQGL